MTKHNHSRGRASVPVSVRLSAEEKQELQNAAKGQTLSDYIRSKLFHSGEVASNKLRFSAYERQKLLAQILAELAKTNLSTSLHEISQAAKIGALPLTPDALANINAAILHVKEMRKTLLQALGLKGNNDDP